MFIYLFQNSCIRPLALSCKRLYFIFGMNVINDLCICVLHLKLWMLALIQGLALQSQGSFPLQRRDLTDVQNAFLNGEFSEEVYMQPPPGYSVPEGMVCRLRRSLYGLKQAPRAWFERFASVVTAAGFSPSAHDPALFVHTSPRGRTLLLLYVDDMIITADDSEYI